MNVSDLKVHHFGVAVSSIEEASKVYRENGFLCGEPVVDEILKLKTCFLEKPDEIPVELISPLAEDALVSEILQKSELGVEPYCVCYEVKGLENLIAELQEQQGWLLVQDVVPARAFGNAKIAFMYSESAGIIELLEVESN